jgi:hypothetical protein
MNVRRQLIRIVQCANANEANVFTYPAHVVIAPNSDLAINTTGDVLACAAGCWDGNRFNITGDQSDLSRLKESITRKSRPRIFLTPATMTTMNDHGFRDDLIPDIAARAASLPPFVVFTHAMPHFIVG